MRNTILILFITLFSFCSPPSRQNSHTNGSKKADNCDCRIFTTDDFSWDGSCVNGLAEGKGTVIWTDQKYIGEVTGGRISGYGIKYLYGEKLYEGYFQDNKYQGEGRLYSTDGEITYQGSFESGVYSGYGIEYLYGEKYYEGYFQDGKYYGKGTLYSTDGNITYQGDFEKGMYSGNGVLYSLGMKVYEGEFSYNKANGYGILYNTSAGIARQGYFENNSFALENKAVDYCDQMGRQIVDKSFNGGQNIRTEMVSFIMDRENEKIEAVFDLKFNGDWISSNFYQCRCKIIERSNDEIVLDFLYKNQRAEDYLATQNIFNVIVGGALVGMELKKFFDE